MLDWLFENIQRVLELAWVHAILAGSATLIGLVLALIFGVALASSPWLTSAMRVVVGVLFTIPSLTLLIFIPVLLGTRILDPINIVIALSVYSFSLIFGGVVQGMRSVSDETYQAAEAMGIGRIRLLFAVKLPLGIPVIAASLRVAAVSCVSLVSVGALIGVGGLGDLFTDGFQRGYLVPIFWGIVFSVALAIVFDLILVACERMMTPWMRAEVSR